MPALLALLLCWSIVLLINVVPAFMPPSWAVMALFRLTAHLPLPPLTIGGAAMSTLGRIGLALLSRHLAQVIPQSDRDNAQALAAFVNRHRNWREAIVFAYCLAPLPSNPLFITAGIGRIPLRRVAIAFFLSRAIADTFWVWSASKVSGDLGRLFYRQLTSWQSIALQVVALSAILVLFRLPWARWLGAESKADQKA